MKKNPVLTASARLVSAVLLMSSTALAVPAAAFSTIAGDDEPIDFGSALNNMRMQNDQINHMAAELIGMIQDQQLADPIALDSFDYDAVATKFANSGLIIDVTTFIQAAKTIEKGGFTSFIDDATKRMSAVDKMFAEASSKLSAWAELDEEDRNTAVLTSNSSSPLAPIARMQTSMNQFVNYVMAGALIYAELTHTADTDQGKLSETQKIDPALV